jgi:Sortase domain
VRVSASRRPASLALVAAVLSTTTVVGVGLAASSLARDEGAPAGAGPDAVASRVSVAASPARRAGAVAPEAPTGVRLPSGTHVPVRAASTRANGVLDVPADVAAAGWWNGGSRLGDPFGSTLLAGHVDSTDQGLGAYAELLSVRPRARIRLYSAHLEQEFRVDSLRLIGKGAVRRERSLYSPAGDRRLTLVTCAPPYDRSRGGYRRLAVVTAVPVSDAEDRRSP